MPLSQCTLLQMVAATMEVNTSITDDLQRRQWVDWNATFSYFYTENITFIWRNKNQQIYFINKNFLEVSQQFIYVIRFKEL